MTSYWYDIIDDQIVAIKRARNQDVQLVGEMEKSYTYQTAVNRAYRLTSEQIGSKIKSSIEEALKFRQAYLNRRIDQLERMKITDPEIVEFKI